MSSDDSRWCNSAGDGSLEFNGFGVSPEYDVIATFAASIEEGEGYSQGVRENGYEK